MALVTQALLTDGTRNRAAWLRGNNAVGSTVTLTDHSVWKVLQLLKQADEADLPVGVQIEN